MKILVGCEFSGIVRDSFAAKGHYAVSCDLLPSERPGNHIQDDVLKHLDEGWDLAIFHPPCTRLCNSGVRWLAERDLWREMYEACLFFLELLKAPVPRVAIENPIPHKYARGVIGHYQQQIHPWLFGEAESKATCLWLKNLPPLMATIIETDRKQRCFLESPGPERWKNRSRTPTGLAQAMANQWT